MFMLACYFLCATSSWPYTRKGYYYTTMLTLAMRINMSCTTTTLFAAYNSMPYFML